MTSSVDAGRRMTDRDPPSGSKSLSRTGMVVLRPGRSSTVSGRTIGGWLVEATSATDTTTMVATGSAMPSEMA